MSSSISIVAVFALPWRGVAGGGRGPLVAVPSLWQPKRWRLGM